MAEINPKNTVQNSLLFTVGAVSDLIKSVQPISDDTFILQVLTQFQDDPQLFALPVTDQSQRFCGIISRRHFLNLMTQAFARELYAKKPLSYLMRSHRNLFTTPLIIHADQRLDQIMLELLRRDPGFHYDALPVIRGRAVLGVIKVADMMLKLSKSQGHLIKTMQQLSARLNAEVIQAASLQRNLLRPPQIDLPGVTGLSTMITASEVGGDFYDYYVVAQRWVVLMVGDVSGHGIAAGTIVCAVKAAVDFLQREAIGEPREVLSRLNSVVYNTAHQSLLMTMFVVSIDTHTGAVEFANAGHQFAYLYRSLLGMLEPLEVGGLPLGKNETSDYEVMRTQIDIGDKLFLYTDAIVEEENPAGECFGYDRLEALILQQAEVDADDQRLHQIILASLSEFTGRTKFEDDITLFSVRHHERTYLVEQSAAMPAQVQDTHQPKLIAETQYRRDPAILGSHLARQQLVFLGETAFQDLLPSLARHGVRRVLRKSHAINQHLGWDKLLQQHHTHLAHDLASFLPAPEHSREFHFSHSEDKSFIIEEIEAWLQEQNLSLPERIDEVVFLLDELIENGLYAAPRDGKGRAMFAKGTARAMFDEESLCLAISMQQGVLGLTLIDSWGTLTPQIFLNRLSHHAQGLGIEAGVGGGGLYLMWRMSDYLQIRVVPNRQTQVSLFLDMNSPNNDELDTGFQFLYHTEVLEMAGHA